MKTLKIDQAPGAVKNAFYHVKSIFPEIVSVEYDAECRWAYRYESGFPPAFDTRIDVGILNDGADAQYNIEVPIVYEE